MRLTILLFLVFTVLLLSACRGEIVHQVSCNTHGECGEGAFCDSDTNLCTPWACQPGEAICEGNGVIRCNHSGSGFGEPNQCEGGSCSDGQCVCLGDDDCGDGESCTDGVCGCPSGLRCGTAGTCCGDDEECAWVQECGDEDDCRIVAICQVPCPGELCGAQGDVCCEGDTPICGPTGECAPSCDGQGELCGDDFDVCCASGDVCVFGDCRTPGADCTTFVDCDWGEYCDAALGRCMPDDFPGDIECRMPGEFLDMEVVQKWGWAEEDIISIPVVGDVNGDGQPNVVVNTARTNGQQWDFHVGNIVVLDSAGNELYRIPHEPNNNRWGSQGRANIALADINGNGRMEIIYKSRTLDGQFGGPAYVVAADGATGNTLWLAHDGNDNPVQITAYNGAITVANFDDDPSRAQIVIGAMLINHDGQVVWNAPPLGYQIQQLGWAIANAAPADPNADGPLYGSNAGYIGGVAVVADLTGDGTPNIVTGKHAWTVQWDPNNPAWAANAGYHVSLLWEHDGPDGYPAVADISGDGKPEVVLVGAASRQVSGTVRILEGDTGKLWCGRDPSGAQCQGNDHLRTQPISLPDDPSYQPSTGFRDNRGGPPTVADFDGDGRPEIGVAGGHYYTVFDINRVSFGDDPTPEVVDQALLAEHNQPQPEPGEIYVRWKQKTQDYSSNTTGSTVFDFQGNGVYSVIYGDECFVRVYSGSDGEVELEIMNSQGTILEYPIVVDVDANGRSEIVVVANYVDWGCSNHFPDFQPRKGIFVYEDPNDRWVRTRSIWNQHAYHIDNILDNGSVPMTQLNSWETHNTFRANRQGEVPLNAADVVVTAVRSQPHLCPPAMELQATIQNRGVAAIPAGLPVTLYDVQHDLHLETVVLDQPISPGGTVTVNFAYTVPESRYNQDLHLMVVANDDGSGEMIYDCNPESASYLAEPVRCLVPL